ncbi:MAG: SDR family NAD(P)-dependent oxidoreductase [Polyangiaceae bacterium]|nr:SDR family NAD(P)-dependent oxidoreductase [Polyangiaceae bacterium]
MHIAVTGASSGIGASFARELARAGYRLTLVARRADLLHALAKDLAPAETHIAPHDLSDVAHVTDWIEGAERALGPIDVLVNNAGVQIVAPTAEVDPEQADRLLAVDLAAPLRLTRAVLPAMLARRSGTIVDVASMAALAPTPGMAHYNAAKAGLAAASESLRGELRGSGVHVVTVYPGIIASTAMASAALEKYEPSRLLSAFPRGTEEELARRMRVAIERRQDRVIYPSSGVLSRWFPTMTRWALDRFTPPLRALPAHGGV